MMADFAMYAGDSKTLRVTVFTDTGLPADITGADIRWQMASHVGGTPQVSKAVGTGITIVDGAAGRFDVSLAPLDTLELKGCWYHEAEIVNVGTVSTVLVGSATITPALIQ